LAAVVILLIKHTTKCYSIRNRRKTLEVSQKGASLEGISAAMRSSHGLSLVPSPQKGVCTFMGLTKYDCELLLQVAVLPQLYQEETFGQCRWYLWNHSVPVKNISPTTKAARNSQLSPSFGPRF